MTVPIALNQTAVAKKLEISGVVQGVGFRPFLFGLADQYHLKGEVFNTSGGIRVIVEGPPEKIERFVDDIYHKSPLLASVTDIKSSDVPPGNFFSFKIENSEVANRRTTLISPDVAICSDCLAEMKDPGNRRHEYEFINCTNCGPRYTIIKDIPYDRSKTSMKSFKMCGKCQQEYDDPLNRRFHAQPNACPVCGPQVFLTDRRGNRINTDSQSAITLAAQYLRQGRIIGIKGLGGFHLACDAANLDAVKQLRQRKNRPHKPFALMAASASILFDHVHVSNREKQLLTSYQRPIVLLKRKYINGDNQKGSVLATDVAFFNKTLGVMLPYAPLHCLLLEKGPSILVMTSGNLSGEPLSIENEDALEAFSHIADYFLLHNRDICFRADDSIARIQAGETRFIRRSRGYAPLPVFINRKMPKILGCGAGFKNAVCLTRGHHAFLSQHIGDLDNMKTHAFYRDSIDHLKNIFDIQPDIIAHDMHHGYMSTDYAKAQNTVKKVAVQHHHAHAAACMAENGLDEEVIAITLDGTGYGTDGHIWGGEILLCTQKAFKRKAHLSYIKMPGGDAAVLEPWRMAASVLFQVFGKDFLQMEIPYIKAMEKEKLSFICGMMEKNLNSPLTSSVGRLFDAVSSLLCVRHTISYESQAAMELEAMADERPVRECYAFDLVSGKKDGGRDQVFEINLMPCIRQITAELQQGRHVAGISAKFHYTLAQAFAVAALKVSLQTHIQKIILSGGVFHNDIILNTMILALEEHNLKVYTHTQVPTGDGGICLGQAVVAAALEGS
ncbi:carbamoyltransferase HypF [Desulfobacula toluolica]|uniref:Carbamoyltransferase n=1 Tax=Desulfobacula toluolica (strain DSM 7467 / Tol2) TaxID=651182 RepID=K0NIT7_DESTT|nr:carbamoyltransferase HypF [Desulfobacula toluolica]CCK78897.1 HypF: hydrogenase maturation factor [Desulfobacula toluolica Tol2]